MTTVLLLALFLPWMITLLRWRRFESRPRAACAAFVATGGILLSLAMLRAMGLADSLTVIGRDSVPIVAVAGIGMMIAAVACALIERRQ